MGTDGTAISGVVRGRVQGVAFRFAMQRAARDLGVAGWVRNQPDGSVAFHVEGSPTDVTELVRWAESGPAAARVDQLNATSAELAGLTDFEILR
jgi:acylphosphatase